MSLNNLCDVNEHIINMVHSKQKNMKNIAKNFFSVKRLWIDSKSKINIFHQIEKNVCRFKLQDCEYFELFGDIDIANNTLKFEKYNEEIKGRLKQYMFHEMSSFKFYPSFDEEHKPTTCFHSTKGPKNSTYVIKNYCTKDLVDVELPFCPEHLLKITADLMKKKLSKEFNEKYEELVQVKLEEKNEGKSKKSTNVNASEKAEIISTICKELYDIDLNTKEIQSKSKSKSKSSKVDKYHLLQQLTKEHKNKKNRKNKAKTNKKKKVVTSSSSSSSSVQSESESESASESNSSESDSEEEIDKDTLLGN